MTDWKGLERELDTWAARRRKATLWWRDDDAVRPTPALDRLLDLAETTGVPVTLAVIPLGTGTALARLVRGAPRVSVVQHGFSHLNRAPPGAKKAELAAGRDEAEVGAELSDGRKRLEALFKESFRPILVPPWNRIDPDLLPALPGAGLTAVSAFARRAAADPAPGLRQVNCHVDVIDWHGGRGFVGAERALTQAVEHLAARRQGGADGDEPTGLLTHHLVHDKSSWAFVGDFLRLTGNHGGVRWIDADEAAWPEK